MRLNLLLCLLVCCLVGCSGSKKNETDNKNPLGLNLGKTVKITKKGDIIEVFDLNGDSHPDVRRIYRKIGPVGKQVKRLIRTELDINFDKKTDIWRYYDLKTGELRKVEMDLDFDGKIDSITHYQNGKIVLKEMDLEFDERMDVRKYYRKGRLVRIERDTNNDKKVDLWIYYNSAGKISRVGMDKDGDGKIDHWEAPEKKKK